MVIETRNFKNRALFENYLQKFYLSLSYFELCRRIFGTLGKSFTLPAALCIDTCYGHVLGTLHPTLWSRLCLTILFMNHFSGLENSTTGNWDNCIPAYCTYAPRFFGICTPVCTYKPHMFLSSSFAYILYTNVFFWTWMPSKEFNLWPFAKMFYQVL
jgi:hypothetical protein